MTADNRFTAAAGAYWSALVADTDYAKLIAGDTGDFFDAPLPAAMKEYRRYDGRQLQVDFDADGWPQILGSDLPANACLRMSFEGDNRETTPYWEDRSLVLSNVLVWPATGDLALSDVSDSEKAFTIIMDAINKPLYRTAGLPISGGGAVTNYDISLQDALPVGPDGAVMYWAWRYRVRLTLTT